MAKKTGGKAKVEKVDNTRKAKIARATKGHKFTLVSPDVIKGAFTCICGGKGSKAYKVKDEGGHTLLVGATCLEHCGIKLPKPEKKPKAAGPVKKTTKVSPPKVGKPANAPSPFAGEKVVPVGTTVGAEPTSEVKGGDEVPIEGAPATVPAVGEPDFAFLDQ